MHFISSMLAECTVYEQDGVINVQYVHDNGIVNPKLKCTRLNTQFKRIKLLD